MQLERLWRATSFRLALWQTLLYLAAFVVAGVMASVVVRRDELQAVDAEVLAEVGDLRAIYASGGRPALLSTIAARQRDPSIWEFRVQDEHGRRISGDLPDAGPPAWSTRGVVEADTPDHELETVRAFRTALPDSLLLTVGEDLGQRERSDNSVLEAVLAVVAASAALSLIIGAALAHRALARVEDMTTAMERYGAGELKARAPTAVRAASDLDRLAVALNQMLERTTRLMSGMRQVSVDIAHDLRRPLARHNERISRTLLGPASVETYREALAQSQQEVDEVLRTFQALLHIAELEAGAPGLFSEPVDLGEVAERVIAAFLPLAEEGGRSLELAAMVRRGALLTATPRLLSQLTANLIENALIHTPVGSRVIVAIEKDGLGLSVTDNGPGVPAEAREHIFERFTRLDASRNTPGTGLGLALAAAIARAFHGRLYAEDASPGLRIVADFSRSPHVLR